jgi:hypothetical protein
MTTYKEAEYNNQTAKFWLLEDPEVMETGKNTLRYYPKAQRLVIHLPDYKDGRSGNMLPGKGCGLNLEALAESPEVLDRVIDILSGLKI